MWHSFYRKVNLVILLDYLLFLSAVPEVTCASDKCEGDGNMKDGSLNAIIYPRMWLCFKRVNLMPPGICKSNLDRVCYSLYLDDS